MIKTKRPGIDVTVVLFYKAGQIPVRIDVKEITIPLVRSMRGYITGLSGHQRMESLMFARQYADAKKMEMIVIDLLVGFTQPMYPNVMPPELVHEHDVLNLFRVSKSLIAEIAAYWREWIVEGEGEVAANQYDWARPADFVARRPDLLPRLLEQEAFAHINLVTHPVLTSFSDQRPVTATSFRVGYPRIERVSARFHPDIEIVN